MTMRSFTASDRSYTNRKRVFRLPFFKLQYEKRHIIDNYVNQFWQLFLYFPQLAPLIFALQIVSETSHSSYGILRSRDRRVSSSHR